MQWHLFSRPGIGSARCAYAVMVPSRLLGMRRTGQMHGMVVVLCSCSRGRRRVRHDLVCSGNVQRASHP